MAFGALRAFIKVSARVELSSSWPLEMIIGPLMLNIAYGAGGGGGGRGTKPVSSSGSSSYKGACACVFWNFSAPAIS